MELHTVTQYMNNSIQRLLKELLKFSFKSPSQAAFITKTLAWQSKAAKLRSVHETQGLHVPAFMIASITQSCNLHCKGCYAHAQHRENSGELDEAGLDKMVQQAKELGISIILLAGGEPLVRKQELLSIANAHKQVIFPMFTNGLLIDDAMLESLKTAKNLIPIVSIEGLEEATDSRRGEGVYQKLKSLFASFKKKDIFYGASITVNTQNLHQVTDAAFVSELIDGGCKLFFYVEYVPVEAGTDELALGEKERDAFMERLNGLRSKLPAFFIAFPGDEKDFGGCIASGRGFIHVSAQGNVEPCPFAPFSDSNLKDKSLRECIESDFLSKIRENHELLTEGQGGCALWEKQDLVKSFIAAGRAK